MKLSGNGNATQFFKKHGVTEVQMQSEKKYTTKAAQEYKRYLAKLLSEADIDNSSPLKEAPQSKISVPAWESSSGLDNLLKSVSGSALNELEKEAEVDEPAVPTTVFRSGGHESVPVMAAAPLPTTPVPALAPVSKPIEKKEPQVFGTLSIKVDDTSANADATKTKIGLGPKKTGNSKKIVARKLVSTSSNIGMETFEDVDKRAELAKQELADHELAVKLHNTDFGNTGSSSRLAAVYQESESIYKPSPAPTKSSAYSNPRESNSRNGGNTMPSTVPLGGGQAVQKFSSAKGISSDQYFDRNAEANEAMKERLGNFKNSTAISSDMLNGNYSASHGDVDRNGVASSLENFIPDEISMRQIKASVRGFFDSVQNM